MTYYTFLVQRPQDAYQWGHVLAYKRFGWYEYCRQLRERKP
jgi:hypothetical protein